MASLLFPQARTMHLQTRNVSRGGQQLPYACAYMQETVFYDPGYNLSLPRRWDIETLFTFIRRGFYVNDILPANIDLEVVGSSDGMPSTLNTEPLQLNTIRPTFYWEVEITVTQPQRGASIVGIGFHGDTLQLFEWGYLNLSESVLVAGEWKQLPSTVMDVLGCGLFPPYGIFFTQNGRLIDFQVSCPDFDTSLRACIRVDQQSQLAIEIDANLGYKPFSFDIAAYLRHFSDRIRRRWATLPMEVLENILAFILLAIDEDMDSEFPTIICTARHALGQMSCVCHRWCTLCRGHIFPTLRLTSGKDLSYTLAQPLRWDARSLVTHEESETPWIHCLLTSALPSRLTRAEEWRCTTSGTDIFTQKLPPSMSHAIALFMRRGCFANITRLTLRSLRFKNWLHFARFVFSIPQLDELSLKGVKWNHNRMPLNPPRWMRFSRRIRAIKVIDNFRGKCDELGLLCLLTAGRRSSTTSALDLELELLPQDIAATSSIVQALCWVDGIYLENILYEQLDGICTVKLAFSQTLYACAAEFILKFVRHPSEPVYQLAHVEATIAYYWADVLKKTAFERVAASLLKLSNPGCSYHFDVRPDSRDHLQQLVARWRICQELGTQFEVDVIYDPIASQLWTFNPWGDKEDLCSICVINSRDTYEAGEHVFIIWAVPFKLRQSPPRVTLLLRHFVRGENVKQAGGNQGNEAEGEETEKVEDDAYVELEYYWAIDVRKWENGADVPVEYTVRHIANLDMGVADVVLPELRTRSLCVFEITLNGCICRSEPVQVKPRPCKKTLRSSETM